MEAIGCRLLLGNTYHLAYKPTGDLLEKFGGIEFVLWNVGDNEKDYINLQDGNITF